MFKNERQKKILAYVNGQHSVTVTELSRRFGVSVVTIRSDINELMQMGLVIKVHGGVTSLDSGITSEIPFEIKNRSFIESKQQIAERAASYITSHDMILIDSGSTTGQLIPFLPEGITVVTPDLLLCVEIIKTGKDIELLVPGGTVNNSVYTLGGVDTIRFIESVHCSKVFLSTDAMDPVHGLTDRTRISAQTKLAMIESAEETILLADSSKMGRVYSSRICSFEKIGTLITDSLGKETLSALDDLRVKVELTSGKSKVKENKRK